MPSVLPVVIVIAAVADWVAVAVHSRAAERILKPLTLVLLLAAAASADVGTAKPWVVAALAFSLIGDTALLREDDTSFLVGLSAFLLGHVCYLIAFLRVGATLLPTLVGVLIVAIVSALALPRVIRGAAAAAGAGFAAAVTAYAGVLGSMTALGVGTAITATAAGAALFLASDTGLAWGRFVGPVRYGPLAVIVTYHLAQVLIVVGLIGAA